MTNSLQHNLEIHQNQNSWSKKPVLQKVYIPFYELLKTHLNTNGEGLTLELGSGMGNIKKVIPHCLTSDLFANPWLDRQENAYQLQLPKASLANLILFDVWHHLEYPANFLQEAQRVLSPNGHLLILDPDMSLTGRFVYGLFHHEPLKTAHKFSARPQKIGDPQSLPYFAAQSSAHRLLLQQEIPDLLANWEILHLQRLTSFSYLLSGGFQKPQLYPSSLLPTLQTIDCVLSQFPKLFACRLLAVLKPKNAHP